MISGLGIANIGIFIIFGSFCLSMLPKSPFTQIIEGFSSVPYLAAVNFFLPVSEMIAAIEGWLVCITAYITVSLIARWIKIVS